MAGSVLGTPKRYLCSATFTPKSRYTGKSKTRYLIREVISPKTGKDLTEAVAQLFISDLEGPEKEKDENPRRQAYNEEMRRVNRDYLIMGLSKISIDELPEGKRPIIKRAD